MSARTTGRIVGALFLLAYVVYLAGGAMASSGSASTVVLSYVAGHQLQISAGTLLMLLNSAAVIGIGVLIFPILAGTTRTLPTATWPPRWPRG